jgi:hypothetical protein
VLEVAVEEVAVHLDKVTQAVLVLIITLTVVEVVVQAVAELARIIV